MTKDLTPAELAEVVRFGIHPELAERDALVDADSDSEWEQAREDGRA